MKNNVMIARLTVLTYYILGGFDFILIDQITGKIPSILMISFRLVICGIILACFALIKRCRFSFSKIEWVRIIICGALGIVVYYIIEAIGISMTSGSIASLVLATIPVFGIISGAFLFKEKVTITSIICIVLSIAGVVLVVVGNGSAAFAATITGIVVMVVAAIVWVMYIVMVKPLKSIVKPLELTTLLFIIGGIICIPIFIGSNPALLMNLSVSELILTVLSAVFIITLGQLGYIYGVDKVSVKEISLYANLIPIITVVFSFIFFKEVLTLMQIIGGAIILISITIASKE